MRADVIGRSAAAAAVVAALLGATSPALAFCRTTTCTHDCDVDSITRCTTSGKTLFWRSKCVSFSVQKDASPKSNLKYDDVNGAVVSGFLTWMHADCGGSPPDIELWDKGNVDCSKQEYNQNAPNANIWMFRDAKWPYDDTGATLALTTITFNVDDGEIFDADVEINSFGNPITIGDTAVGADLRSIATHEAGHFLGLAHTLDGDATMYASYSPGDISLRSLAPDDVAGICAIYPPSRKADCIDSATPRHGFSPLCYVEKEDDGCSTSAPGDRRGLGSRALVVLAMGALAVLGRRRRNPR